MWPNVGYCFVCQVQTAHTNKKQRRFVGSIFFVVAVEGAPCCVSSSLCFAWLVGCYYCLVPRIVVVVFTLHQMNCGCVSLFDPPTDLPLGACLCFHTLTHPYPTASLSSPCPLLSIEQLFVHVCVVHVWTLIELGVHLFSREHGLMHILPTLFVCNASADEVGVVGQSIHLNFFSCSPPSSSSARLLFALPLSSSLHTHVTNGPKTLLTKNSLFLSFLSFSPYPILNLIPCRLYPYPLTIYVN